jgi:hypothetical protein
VREEWYLQQRWRFIRQYLGAGIGPARYDAAHALSDSVAGEYVAGYAGGHETSELQELGTGVGGYM